jgi:hypothetical protein
MKNEKSKKSINSVRALILTVIGGCIGAGIVYLKDTYFFVDRTESRQTEKSNSNDNSVAIEIVRSTKPVEQKKTFDNCSYESINIWEISDDLQGNSGKINGRTRQDSPVIEEVDPETKKEVDGADPNWYLLPDPKYGKGVCTEGSFKNLVILSEKHGYSQSIRECAYENGIPIGVIHGFRNSSAGISFGIYIKGKDRCDKKKDFEFRTLTDLNELKIKEFNEKY